MDEFDYGFDLGAFLDTHEFSAFEDEHRFTAVEGDTLLREFDQWDEEYVEFDDEVFDL